MAYNLPEGLARTEKGLLQATSTIEPSAVLAECTQMCIYPTHIMFADGLVVNHEDDANTVFVEHSLVTKRVISVGETITVNMNLFVYDMQALFPDSYSKACRGFKSLPMEVKQRDLYLSEPHVRAQAMQDGFIVQSSNQSITVRPNGDMGQTAYATRNIPKGTTLFRATGLLVPYPTMYTICVGSKLHLLFGDAAECLAHHCDPNVQVNVLPDATFEMTTIRDIDEGDMVTFCYNTTEWDMNSPFPCLCGSPVCSKMIRGFKHLGDADRQRLWHIASDYIKSLCN